MNIINKFSPYLFWDVDKTKLDMDLNAFYIIPRVFDYGRLGDVRLITSHYKEDTIKRVVQEVPYLDPRTISYLSLLYDIPMEQFRAYGNKSGKVNWK
jgi:hypothetical protein